MAIYLDDQALEVNGPYLGSALVAAEKRLQDAERVVVEVWIDGEALVGERLDQQRGDTLADRELRLYSTPARDLAVRTLDQIHGVLAEARDHQDQAVELLQQDRAGEAMKRVNKAIDGWLQTQQAVLHSSVLVGVDMETLDVDGATISEIVQDLVSQLTDLREIIESRDSVGLADTLFGEWSLTVDQWDRLVTVLSDHIETAELGPGTEPPV